jgi:two-component system, chemotaxis family, response regulator Rcp1
MGWKQSDAIDVLLVEDSPGDVRLTREAFKDAKVKVNLHVASDGMEAMDFLLKKGRHQEAPRPDLVLLDLNLPRKNGREVLTDIKRDETLRSIPVVILTTSAADADIERSYHSYANCYIAKPVSLEGFCEVVKSIDSFWLTIVKLPHGTIHE